MKKIGLASDHAGFELKEYVKTWLKAKNYPFEDFGTYSTDSCDYPDLHTRWHWQSKPENVIRVLLSVVVVKVSA